MGCVHSSVRMQKLKEVGGSPIKAKSEGHVEILELGELSSSGRHSFVEKTLRRGVCDVCRKNMSNTANVCSDCKLAVHKSCQPKVASSCSSALDLLGSSRSSSLKKRGSLPRSRSMERVMEQRYDFDLTYITERIISVFFPELDEPQYHHNIQEVALMLKNKHHDKFMLLNLSEKRHDITRLNPKVQDFGWPDLHAPPLDRICSVCKAMENWLSQDPQNVVVLHCKGNKGKTGVMVAAYMHYSKISAGADQALTTLAMRKFCEDKVSSSLQPSQNRYIYYFSGLLSGSIQMNSSPLFLQQIVIPTLPHFQPGGGFFPFVMIYQSLQLVFTSGVYDPQKSRARKLCVTVDTPLLLKGDIMVKCFHRRSAAEREEVFRVQFHTCAVHGAQLWFRKADLDHACNDDRFPPDGTVEFLFSNGPEKIKGREYRKNDSSVKVNNDTSDRVVRWDSYENFNLHHEDSIENISHTRGPLDGSLYAQVRRRRSAHKPSSANGDFQNGPTIRSPPPCLPRPLPSVPNEEQEATKSSTPNPNPATNKNDPNEKGERETAILDDESSRKDHSRCSQNVQKSSPREKEPCLVSSHCHTRCNCVKNNPKSQTLPVLASKSTSIPPVSQMSQISASQLDVCHLRGAHTHQDFAPVPLTQPCLYQKCYPCPQLEHRPIPLSHVALPNSQRLCTGSDFQLYFPSQNPPMHLSQPALPTAGPYRELFIGPTNPICPCRDCSAPNRREPIRTFHPIHADQSDSSQWSHGVRERDLWETPWQRELWQYHKTPVQAFHSCPATVTPSPALDQRRFPGASPGTSQAFPSPQSLNDVREAGRSECHSPPQPEAHVSCPCVPALVSPTESSASGGRKSGSNTPSPSRASPSRVSPNKAMAPHSVAKTAMEQTERRAEREALSSSPTAESEHDYSLISSSPTHTQESLTPDSTAAQTPETTRPPSSLDKSPPPEDQSRTVLSPSNPSTSPPNQDPSPASSNPQLSSPVLVQINGSTVQSSTDSSSQMMSMNSSPSPTSTLSSPSSPEPSPQRSSVSTDQSRHSLTPDLAETKPPSPVPDGYNTPNFPLASYYYPLLNVPHVPYSGYTAVTIPSQPPLPEKKRGTQHAGLMNGHGSLQRVLSAPEPSQGAPLLGGGGEQRRGSAQVEPDIRVNAKFVQDSSKFWYKPGISRDQAIAVLKDKEPGCFLIRDSNSFQGAYGLALKVETAPPNANLTGNKGADPLEQLVRHFLIETGPRGVKIKGCQNEAYFGSLSALVFQHSITPVSLPCALRIPEKDLVGELEEIQSVSSTSTAASLLRQGAACNVLYLNSVETESLTGPEAVSKATKVTLSLIPRPVATVVHFKVSVQGITLTDSKRRLFFRRHYPINTVTFSSLDPQNKRMFGFVARRTGSSSENVCHLFAEIDPEQPAIAIVNFINKVMLAPHLRR